MSNLPENRVRLNQNPFVSAETKREIENRIAATGKSLGRVLDDAIAMTTKSKSTQRKIKSCRRAK